MRVEFWKEGITTIIIWAVIVSALFGAVIAGIVLVFSNDDYWILIAFGGVFWVWSIGFLLSSFQKVVISDDGIELKYGKKQLAFISWYSITKVDTTNSGIGTRYLTFFEEDKRIDIILDPKPFHAIMDICPNANVKYNIENLPRIKDGLKWYLKKRRK